MVEEIIKKAETLIANLEMRKAKAVNDRDYELHMELEDQIRGAKMVLEIVERCRQRAGRATRIESANGSMESAEERITAETVAA